MASIFSMPRGTQGKRTILVTNAHPKSPALKLKHTRLGDHLDALVSAHDLGYPKEAPAFWEKLHRQRPFDQVPPAIGQKPPSKSLGYSRE